MNTRISTARRDIDGMAVIGRTLHDLRGIRYDEGEGGNASAAATGAGTTASSSTAGIATSGGAETSGTQAATAAAASTGNAQTTASAEKVEDLPAWAQKIITDTRKEAGDARVAKKAEEDRVNAILKAAGIKTDEPDPVAVAAQATEAATKATRELAVFKAAAVAGADPVKLLDRTSFTASIAGVDPSDGAALKAAIEAAVLADNTLKAARAAGASAVETSGGTGEQGQITDAQLAQMTPEQISEAYDNGLLKNLLN